MNARASPGVAYCRGFALPPRCAQRSLCRGSAFGGRVGGRLSRGARDGRPRPPDQAGTWWIGDMVRAEAMARLTITLSPDRHRALREAAARRGKTIRSLVEESLDAYGIKTASQAAALVARARSRSSLTEAESMSLAVSETR